MQKLIWQNSNGDEINLTSGNFGITSWEGFSNVELNIQSQQVPFQDGGVFLDALMEPRELNVTLAIYDGNNLKTRYELRRKLIHILNPKLGEGYLIYTNDFISKRIKCVAHIPLFENHNSNDIGTPKANLSWTACEPYWEDLEETSVSISGINNIHYDGDVPASIKLVIDEGTENPIIINRKTGKYIKLNDNIVAGRVIINTDLGKKSVIKENYIIKWIGGGAFISGLFNDNKFIYVGEQIVAQNYATGKLLKTIDGIEEVRATKVRYYGGFYYVSGIVNYIYKSSDLVTWQRFRVPNSIFSFCYNNGMFLIVGGQGIIKSTDLINWDTVFAPILPQMIDAKIEVINNEFVCIMNYNESTAVGFYKSQNGDDWEFVEVQNEPEADVYKSLTYGNGIYLFSMSHKLYKSTDGINFEKIEDFDNFICKKCKFVNDNFVLIGNISPNASLRLYNKNLVYYNQVTLGKGAVTDIIYGNGIYGICGAEGRILNSNNLIDWNDWAVPISSNRSVAYGNGILLACNSAIYKSVDGYKWVNKWDNLNALKVIYGNGVFVLYNNIQPKWVTADGENFTTVETDVSSASGLNDMCYGGLDGEKKFVSVGDFGDSFISDDGRHWIFNAIVIPGFANVFYRTIVYGQGKFYAGASNGLIIMSSNGIDWEIVTQVQNMVLKLIYNEDRNSFIMAIKENNITVLKETYNFVDWVKIAELPSDVINKIWYSKHQYIMFGTNTQNVYITSDLVNFRKLENMTTSIFHDLVRYQDRYILAGGTIAEIIAEDKENIIAKLDSGSDMSLSLENGDNEILFSDDNNTSAMLSYRQKYIGV